MKYQSELADIFDRKDLQEVFGLYETKEELNQSKIIMSESQILKREIKEHIYNS